MHSSIGNLVARLVVATALVVVAGCDKRESTIRSYAAPKEAAPATAPAGGPAISAQAVGPGSAQEVAARSQAGPPADDSTLPFEWTLPAGWQQDPQPRPMRVATVVVDSNGQRGELIVTRFRTGGFGSLVDNLNRWRQQVGLPPVADAGEVTPVQTTVGGAEAKVYDFAGVPAANQNAGGNVPKRNRVVMVETPAGDAWFFRFFGPADLVEAQQGAFESLLQSVKFTN